MIKRIVMAIGLLSLWAVASAATVTYTCPSPKKITVSNCHYWGATSKPVSSCTWRASLLTTAKGIKLRAAGKELPIGPQRIIFVQFYPGNNQISCAYYTSGRFCSKKNPSKCFNGGVLSWSPLLGKCRLENAKRNPMGSLYCLGSRTGCQVVCKQ